MTFTWPTSHSALLVWSELLLAWVVAMYYTGRTASLWGRVQLAPAKRWWTPALWKLVLLIVTTVLVTGRRPLAALALALGGAALALALSFAREQSHDAWRRLGAEVELGATGLYVLLSAVVVGNHATQPLISVVKLALSEGRIAALCLAAAIVGFLERGGTQVVRAILNKVGTFPTIATLPTATTHIDEVEYNRGRLIGSIERLLLAGMAAAGSYAALGFTIAAKGLIRSKDLENRQFAEYFLIGTLASTGLAMAAGGLLRVVFSALW
jgi:hypothetical protein